MAKKTLTIGPRFRQWEIVHKLPNGCYRQVASIYCPLSYGYEDALSVAGNMSPNGTKDIDVLLRDGINVHQASDGVM